MTDTVRTTNRTPSYWLLVKDGPGGTEVLTTGLPDGRQALPVFSFKEEAEMFLCLRAPQEGWRLRKTVAGELLFMFYTNLGDVRCVTLDPIPETSCLDTSWLLNIDRTAFMLRLAKSDGAGDAVKLVGGYPRHPASAN